MLVASLHVAQASPVHATLLLMLPADSTALAIEAMARAGAAAINANPAYYSSVELSIVTTPGRDKAMVSFSDACGVATTQALAGIVGPIYSRDAMLVAPWGAMVGLPMVSYGATSALLSDSTAYTTMMRSVPSDASVIQGVIALLQRYNVTRAVMIAQDDTFGTSGMQSFLSAAANAVPPIAVVLAATFSYRTLKGLDTALNATVAANGRYVVLWASQSLVDSVLLRAAALGLMSPQYSWITSAETTVLAGGAVTAQGTFDGLLQVKPANAQNIPSSPLLTDALVWVSTNYPSAVAVGSLYPVYSFFAYDAVFTLGAGFAQQVQAGGALPSTSTTSCFSPASSNDTASVLMSRLRGLVFRGVTGVVAYSATSTDREDPVISVASLVDSTSGRQSQNVALWQPTLGFSPANFRVTWFGGAAVPPPDRDVLAGRVLRALTVSSPPFVYLPSDTTPTYSGFAIDVVSAIGQKLGFTVEYDEQVNGTYNQLVRAAGERRYDLGVADITVTNARLFYADFCMPYYADHMTMAVRKPVQQALSLWSFMQPFAPTVWVVLGAASVACGLLFFLFENGHSDDLIRLGGGNVWKVALVSVYTSLAVMLMREGAEPSTPAGRLLYLGIVVCSTVVISTYTALVVNSISVAAAVSLITGIRDIASGKLSSSKVGIPSGSANAAYFTNQFSSVYAPISSIESGFQRLQSGELDAIFWDSSSMTFIVNQGESEKRRRFLRRPVEQHTQIDFRLRKHTLPVLKLSTHFAMQGIATSWSSQRV